MHDGLTSMGFRGFFDVDNLKMISQEALELAVKESVSMIVFVHDETCESEWCRFEWEIAQKNSIPVICVVDMENSDPAHVVERLQATNTYLVRDPVVKYTYMQRKDAIKKVAHWLKNQKLGR